MKKSHQKLKKDDWLSLTILVIAIILTLLIYYRYKSFYYALIPVVIAVTLFLVLYVYKERQKRAKLTQEALALADFYDGVSQKSELGENFKSSAVLSLNEVSNQELKAKLDEYITGEYSDNEVLTLNLTESENEKDLSSLFQFGLTHLINQEFKDSFAAKIEAFRNDIAGKGNTSKKAYEIANYVFVGVAIVVSLFLVYSLFKNAL